VAVEFARALKSRHRLANDEIGMPKNLPVAETESLMLAYAQVNEQDIGQLAGRGALAAKDHQVETGRVPAKRFFLVAANAADTGSAGRRVVGSSQIGSAARAAFALK